jgi:hypothetical protein
MDSVLRGCVLVGKSVWGDGSGVYKGALTGESIG